MRRVKVDLEGAPTSLAGAPRFNDPEKQLQFHTTTGPTGGKRGGPVAFHGHGGVAKDDKEDILRYFHRVDDGLRELLAGEQAPPVLAGVDYLLPLHQKANGYPHLLRRRTGTDAGECLPGGPVPLLSHEDRKEEN